MGQAIGRAPLLPVARHYVNVPCTPMHHLWDAFNDIAEGFGLTSDEMCEILRVCLKDVLGYTEKKLDAISRSLFVALDDDKNELVDALEFLSAMCIISGMSQSQKITFIFGVFDFDESGLLTVDEMILALRSTISGLCKLSGIDLPPETEIERIAVGAFANAKSIEGSTIEKQLFTKYCVNTPEVVSWMEFYADIVETSKPLDASNDKKCERVIAALGAVMARGDKHRAVMDSEGGCAARVAIERMEDRAARPSPPWLSSVAFLEPAEAPEDAPSTTPDECLELEWVHGFNAQRRQNVFYTKRSFLVYSAGAVGVVLDPSNRRQTFYNGHTDLIECLRVYHAAHDTYVATGQLGVTPKVTVWSCNTLEVLSTMRGLHAAGVVHVDFSGDGELLATVGALSGGASDAAPTQLVAIYEWRKARVVFAARVAAATLVLDCRFIQGRDLVTCGVNHVHFWWERGDTYYQEKGLLCRKTQPQPFLCVAAPGDKVVCGAASGHLLVWEGRTCAKTFKVHSGAVTCLYAVGEAQGAARPGLVSASTDGKVQMWALEKGDLELGATFDVAALGGLSHGIHGVCWDPTKNKLGVATDAAEIFEISASEGHSLHAAPVVVGHSERRLSGLAAHPKNDHEVASVGDDKLVYVWHADEHRVDRSVAPDTARKSSTRLQSTTAPCSPWASAAWTTRGKRQRKDGAYVVLDSETLTIIHEARDSKMPITAVAFSPDGLTLALGSEDRALYLYNVGDFAATTKCRGHKGRVLQLDWSGDSKYLQSTDDLGGAATCIFGWPLKGCWPSDDLCGIQIFNPTSISLVEFGTGDDGPDDGCFLAAAARLPGAEADGGPPGHLLATTDNYGRVKLWRYPVVAKDAIGQDYGAHAAPGGAVVFTHDGKRLFSTSRGDGCVFEWRLSQDQTPPDESALSQDAPPAEDACDYATGKQLDRPPAVEASANYDLTSLFLMEERGNDDDYAPLRPDKLELEWVHGYRCHDVRGHVHYAWESRDVMFPAAQLVVLMNHQDRTQRYFREHVADVVGMAVHPTVDVVATGEARALPSVLVWSSTTLECKCALHGYHRRAVPLLAFSPGGGGKYLVTMGCDELHSAVVFDWAAGAVACRTPTQAEKPLALIFSREGSGFGGGTGFACCGVNFLKFWAFSGKVLRCDDGRLGAKGRVQPFLCLGWQGSSLVMGNMDGSLYRFVGKQLDKAVQAHTGAVNCIHTTNEGLCTGGKDGLVKLWTMQLEMKLEVDLTLLGSLAPSARSVEWDNERGRILVGTVGAELWEVDTAEGKNLHPEGPVLFGHLGGHYGGELWALACHPTLPQFCSAGDDKMLRVWSLFEKRMVRCNQLEMMSRACVRKWITELKYAPSGELLAVGSFDNRIYVYVFDGGVIKLQNMITQHNSFVTHVDFSVSANIMYLQSNCGAYELCFFEADTGMFIPAASRLKDVRFTQGVHAAQNDGSDVTACDCSLSSTKVSVACGDNFGRVRLYRYPVTSALAKCKEYRGHGAEVRKVRWSAGDSHLLTLAAHDRCVFQSTALEAPGVVANEGADAKAAEQLAADIDAADDEDELSDDDADPSEMEMTRGSLVYNALGDVVYPTPNLVVVRQGRARAEVLPGPRARRELLLREPLRPLPRVRRAEPAEPAPRLGRRGATAAVVLPPYHRGSTWTCAFDPKSTRLVSVGADNDGSLAIWRSLSGEWHDGALLAAVQGGDRAVRLACFANAGLKDYEGYDLASGGDGHVYFWTLRGQTLTATDPVWGAADDSRVLCGAAVLDRFITAARHLVWKERSCVKQIRAHEHGLESIHAAGDAGFVTGAHDGFVKLWTSRCVHVRSYDLTEATIPPLVPVVHSVHLGLADGDVAKILVGTSSSEVYEIAKSSGSMTLLHEGHYTDELWAVATNPADPDVFATAGDDMTVRVWSVAHRKLLRKAQLDAPCRCLDFSPDGERLLVGMGGTPSGTRSLKDGVFLILDALSLLVQHEGRDSRHWLRCCKFAPDGLSFAVGSMDQKVYIYDAETTHMRAKCLKHNSFVTHLDWSADSKYVQSDARDYEHLYYGALDGAHVRLPSQLKDVEFAGWSCIYGWPTQAPGPPSAATRPRPRATPRRCTGPTTALLASGDEGGAVRLFRYPCAQKFTADDGHLVTVGKQDRSIIVWKIAQKNKPVEDDEAKGDDPEA
ncbi:hypothetical protein JL720_91 [Aureococcus anophagefferens]|nr:hypothetical protein JL720_91 [Aureococcus anophagefferens]